MSRRKPKPRVLHLQGAHSERCPWCTRQWWRWLSQMMARTWSGEAFYEHAATSNRGPGPGEEHADVYPVYVGRPQEYGADESGYVEFVAPVAVDAELLAWADELRERASVACGIPAELLGFETVTSKRGGVYIANLGEPDPYDEHRASRGRVRDCDPTEEP